MAQNLIKSSGSIFMGNPITYKVTSEAEPTTSVVTFHRVKLTVTIGSKEYELSTPAGSQEEVEFDVSSAFRAYAESDVYEPVTAETEYNTYTATIKARDIWLKDGVVIDPAPVSGGTPTLQCSAIRGCYSDYERHLASQTLSFSRKPVDGELVCVGDNVVYGASGSTPKSSVRTITAADGAYLTLPNGQNLYVVASAKGSRMFQFVNSRGIVESIRTWKNKTEKVKSSSEEYSVSRMESFTDFSRIINHKKAQRTEITLSSGFVSYDWAKWWIYEFGQSETHWMLDNGIWIPCSVVLDETATLVDETKTDMCYVQFTCKPDLNGGMW